MKQKKRPNYTGCIQLGTNTVTHKLQASIKALTKQKNDYLQLSSNLNAFYGRKVLGLILSIECPQTSSCFSLAKWTTSNNEG